MDKYNEALEKAKLGLSIDEIFPELKESEGEKIMKEIIQFLRDASNSKTRVISSETLSKWAEFLEKQKEQNPVERLEAERNNWYVCIKDYYRCGKKLCSVGDLVQAKGGMRMMGEEDISEWFRRAYYEEVRDTLKLDTDTNISEKHAEWSEEDENMIRFYEMDYNNQIGDWPAKKVVEMRLAFKDWLCVRLKSLHPQPHWKPSEDTLNFVKKVADGEMLSCMEQMAMGTLYEQLKKLI